MYILSINMWFQTLMRQFFFNIDKIVFNFISTVYDLLISIARTSILSQADILDMADRIYKLLAIFMVFKVTFSLIMYVVNPDDFSDKNKGISKLGTNIIISLALLILTPYVFSYAFELQTIILEDNSLAALIFGEDGEKSFLNDAGDEMAFITMSPFFTPNVSIDAISSCIDLESSECYEAMKSIVSDNDKIMIDNYEMGNKYHSLGLAFRQDLAVVDTEDEVFLMDYKYIFSTIVGVVIILLLITFCMDVAVRSIKLGFLQLIAPIPIISYVDPKSGKDGMFKKWYQMCFKTYLSLFIRLLAIYFAIYIISRLGRMVDIVDGSYVTNAFIKIFIIIGALMFAKQFPKILEGLGIKLDSGGFTLNPLKKLEKEAVGGKALSKAAGMPVKMAKGIGMAGLVGGAALVTGQGFRGMGKAFGGAMKGEKFGKNFSASYSDARARKKQIDEMRANGVNPWDVRKEKALNFFKGQTKAEQIKNVTSGLKTIQDDYTAYTKTAAGVDAIAKDFDKRKSAAEAAGNYAEAKRWSEAFDQRIKEIAQDRGKIIKELNSTFNAETIVGADGKYTTSSAESHAVGNKTTNAALANIAQHMDSLVNAMNEQADGIVDYGYQKISGSTTTDIKSIKNQALGSQQSVETNEETRKINDVAKYTGQKK